MQNGNVGWKFPLAIGPKTGKFETTSTAQDIRQAIIILLNTLKGERLFHPHYGSNLNQFMFEPVSYNLLADIRHAVTESILQQEKRIDELFVDAFVPPEAQDTVTVHIRYTVKATDEPDAITYVLNLLE